MGFPPGRGVHGIPSLRGVHGVTVRTARAWGYPSARPAGMGVPRWHGGSTAAPRRGARRARRARRERTRPRRRIGYRGRALSAAGDRVRESGAPGEPAPVGAAPPPVAPARAPMRSSSRAEFCRFCGPATRARGASRNSEMRDASAPFKPPNLRHARPRAGRCAVRHAAPGGAPVARASARRRARRSRSARARRTRSRSHARR